MKQLQILQWNNLLNFSDSVSIADRNDLLMELHILKVVNKTPHRNVIKLIGAVTNEGIIIQIYKNICRSNDLKFTQQD